MRTYFDEQLDTLNTELIEMGSLIETAISSAVQALLEQSEELARHNIKNDRIINQKEKDIEALCLKLLLHQQPVARDLRLISAALKMITDMERIGDQAADISELVTVMPKTALGHRFEHISQMAKVTVGMVSDSINAFVARDEALAHEICSRDDRVDALFCEMKRDLIAWIREDADSGEQALDLLMVAKYFERIGDHAVNLAEWVIFSVTGQHEEEMNRLPV
ncbi:MAG: phosphate signaling complex protein PhoU [Acutalibacteraceae bacterium]